MSLSPQRRSARLLATAAFLLLPFSLPAAAQVAEGAVSSQEPASPEKQEAGTKRAPVVGRVVTRKGKAWKDAELVLFSSPREYTEEEYDEQRVRTDARGVFRAQVLEDRSYAAFAWQREGRVTRRMTRLARSIHSGARVRLVELTYRPREAGLRIRGWKNWLAKEKLQVFARTPGENSFQLRLEPDEGGLARFWELPGGMPEFEFRGVDGSVRLYWRANAFAKGKAKGYEILGKGQKLGFLLRLRRPVRRSALVLADKSGKPIAGARISAQINLARSNPVFYFDSADLSSRLFTSLGTTDAKGRTSILIPDRANSLAGKIAEGLSEAVRRGREREKLSTSLPLPLLIEAPGHEPLLIGRRSSGLEDRLKFDPDKKTKPLEFHLLPAEAWKLEVRDRDDRPLAGQRIFVGRQLQLEGKRWSAPVPIPGSEYRSDARGHAILHGFREGEEAMLGIGDLRLPIQRSAAAGRTQVFSLAKLLPVDFEFRNADGRPVSHPEVFIARANESGGERDWPLTIQKIGTRRGKVSFELPEGKYRILVRAKRQGWLREAFEVGKAEKRQRRMTLKPMYNLSGRLTNARGRPYPSVMVFFKSGPQADADAEPSPYPSYGSFHQLLKDFNNRAFENCVEPDGSFDTWWIPYAYKGYVVEFFIPSAFTSNLRASVKLEAKDQTGLELHPTLDR